MKIDGYSLLAEIDCAEKPSAIETALRAEGYTFGLGLLENETALKNYLHGEALLDAHIAGSDLASLCASLTVRLPDGRRQHTVETPRSAAGPDLRFLLLGGAGKAGDIEGASIRIRALPEKTLAATYIAHDLETALNLLRARVQNFNPPAWVRLTLKDDEIQSDQARLSFGFEGTEQLCRGHYEDFCAACGSGFTRTTSTDEIPDREQHSPGAPPLYEQCGDSHKAEIQMSMTFSWQNCAAVMRELKKRSAGIYMQQCVVGKAYHHAALLCLRIFSSGTSDWVREETREICALTARHSGRVLELRSLNGDRDDLKELIPSDALIDRIRRAL